MRLLPALVGIALLVWLLRREGTGRVVAAMAGANGALLAGAVVVNLTLNSFARVLRRVALLRPLRREGRAATLEEVASLFFAGQAVNNLLPARAGDVLITAQLWRRHGYHIEGVVASQLLEKLVEIVTLWLLAVPTAFVLRHSQPAVVGIVAAIGVVLGLAFAAVQLASRLDLGDTPRSGWATGLLDRAAAALRLLLAPHVFRPTLLWSFVSDAADVAMVGLCLEAVGVRLGVGAWCLVLLGVNVAVALPISAANLGVLEAGAIVVLARLGVPGNTAMAFAVLYHGAHVVPSTLVGLVELRRLRWQRDPAVPTVG